MRSAAKLLTVAAGVAALAACNKHTQQANSAANQEMSIDDNLTSSGADNSNAQIETLPPDESSTTPSGQLNDGQDSPDANTIGNGDQ